MQTKDQREVLRQLLDDGRMIYRLRPDGLGLERRANPVAHAQAITAVDDAAEQAGFPAAGDRLLAAWNSAYALKPDPSSAYRDAIRAVDAVANPLFLPMAQAPDRVIRRVADRGLPRYLRPSSAWLFPVPQVWACVRSAGSDCICPSPSTRRLTFVICGLATTSRGR
jgi:hypothetical protein